MNRFLSLVVAAALLALPLRATVADGVSGGTGIQALPAAVGIGNSPSIFNPGSGGSQQALVQGSTAYLQSSRASKTGNYTLNSDLGSTSDCARLIKANGSGSIQITAPNPTGVLCTYQIADQSGKGFTVTTPSGTATFYGCVSSAVTTLTVPVNNIVALDDDGANYFCVFSPQTQAAQLNQSQTWGPQNSKACTITASGGVFTPSCPISVIPITASGQHIAVPNFMPPNTASTFINLVLTYGSSCTTSAPCTPIFDGSPLWPGSATPPACSTTITAACFSSVQLPTGSGDWLEGRSIDATHVGYGSPLTNMGAAPQWSVAGHVIGAGCSSATSCGASATLTSGDIVLIANYINNSTHSSFSASPSNIGACTLLTGTHNASAPDDGVYWCSVTGSGSTTITDNYAGTAGYGNLAIIDIHGASGSPDLGFGAIANATSVNSNGSVPAGAFVFVWGVAGSGTATAGTGFTLIDADSSGLATEYSTSLTGTVTGQFGGGLSGGQYTSITALH